MALVEPVGAVLPELDRERAYPKPRPVRRARHRHPFEPLGQLGEPRLELLARGERTALRGSPGPELTAARPGGEVRVGLLVGHPLRRSFEPYLRLERIPPEEQRDGTGERLATFARFEVRVEDEPLLVGALEQHDPRRRPPVVADRGEDHSGRFW